MTINTILAIVLIVLAVVVIGTGIYFYARDKSLDDIRKDVHKKFLEAKEDKTLETGKQKMVWVLQQARILLPKWLQPLITDAFLKKVVQRWFDAVEDLLDDKKLNNSNKDVKTEEE